MKKQESDDFKDTLMKGVPEYMLKKETATFRDMFKIYFSDSDIDIEKND